MSGRRLCTFFVGGLALGIDVGRVQEVMGVQPVTPVPLAPPGVVGLLNLRGRILTVIDARARLGLAPRGAADPIVNVIVHLGAETVSLLVDGAGEVVEVELEAFEEIPQTVDVIVRSQTTGAYKLEGSLLLVLDCDAAVSTAAA